MYRYTYDEIANKYIDSVYRLALSRTKSPENAEDITQDVFLRLCNAKKQFESEEHIKAWLLRVTINLTKDLFSSHWYKTTDSLDSDIAYTPEEGTGIYEMVSALPQKYRTVIHLHYYEGYKIEEIATITKATAGTVKSQLHRARQMLKGIIEEDEEV